MHFQISLPTTVLSQSEQMEHYSALLEHDSVQGHPLQFPNPSRRFGPWAEELKPSDYLRSRKIKNPLERDVSSRRQLI